MQTVNAEILELKQEVKQLRADVRWLEDVVDRVLVSPPILMKMPDGSKRPFSPTRPVSLRTLATMLRVEEEAQKRRNLSPDEEVDLLRDILERARHDAIEKGVAIDDEREAAIGD